MKKHQSKFIKITDIRGKFFMARFYKAVKI